LVKKHESNNRIDSNCISEIDENPGFYGKDTFLGTDPAGDDLADNFDIDLPAVSVGTPKKRLQPKNMGAWLKQYALANRNTTVTGAFVAALLPHDEYHEKTVKQAMLDLGQKGDVLTCVYCEGIPTTWDHLTNSVQSHKANGPGHRVYNLVPCCTTCNSSKGGKNFQDWILGYTNTAGKKIPPTIRVQAARREHVVQSLIAYQKKCPPRSDADLELEEKLMAMRDRVWAIFKEADDLVAKVRPRIEKSRRYK